MVYSGIVNSSYPDLLVFSRESDVAVFIIRMIDWQNRLDLPKAAILNSISYTSFDWLNLFQTNHAGHYLFNVAGSILKMEGLE